MRVLAAVSYTLVATATVTFAQPADGGRRSIVDVVEEDVNGRAPGLRSTATRAAVNGEARGLLDRGADAEAIEKLREAARAGQADPETHYMLAEGLLKQAKSLRERADAAAARGDQAEAARLRSQAEGAIGEALGALGRGRDHAYAVIDERLAAGDAEGARNLANALLRVDPSDARARAAMTASDGVRTAGAAGSAGSTSPWGGGSSGGGGGSSSDRTGRPTARSPWDRYGSDPNSAWDRAVANANRDAGTPASTATAARPSTTTDSRPATTTDAGRTTETPATAESAPVLGRGMQVSAADLEVLARIVKGEALVCSFEGKVAVAAVVLNRVRDSRWPNTIPGVAHQPLQFSCYNRQYRRQLYYGTVPEECFRAARAALAGQDPTGGATHYYNPYLVTPDWARTMRQTRRIGTGRDDTHVFFR